MATWILCFEFVSMSIKTIFRSLRFYLELDMRTSFSKRLFTNIKLIWSELFILLQLIFTNMVKRIFHLELDNFTLYYNNVGKS